MWFGGLGGTDLLSGVYDLVADRFVPDHRAASLNTPLDEFGSTVQFGGLRAVFERRGSPPLIAARARLDDPWMLTGPITGLPSQPYYDPALTLLGGTETLLHVDVTTGDIVARPLAGLVAGSAAVLVRPVNAGGSARAPAPITDSEGRLIGIAHHESVGTDSDRFNSFDLEPLTPAVRMDDDDGWQSHGGFASGRFFDVDRSGSPTKVRVHEAFWFTGGRAEPGAVMEIHALVTPRDRPLRICDSWCLVSGDYAARPMPFYNFHGEFGLDVGQMITVLYMGRHDSETGVAVLELPLPNQSSLEGVVLAAQALTRCTGAPYAPVFGNTGALTVH
jgi:hypothetical protein